MTHEDKLQDMALVVAMYEVMKELVWNGVIVEFVDPEEILKCAKELLQADPDIMDEARAILEKRRKV